ncbi:MAG: hypothetical protein GQ535_09370 [Rhodobacteraceae bacterium]|nr:hypothetical protein [Paracoccaceae bacterium]
MQSWYYHLGFSLEGRRLRQISDSGYQMVVIEPIYTEAENTDYPIEATLARLHQKPRIVLAYIDIGQAEEWRTYWQPNWRIGAPAWIVANDPDGWEGNYPVAYWHPEWKQIWLGQNGLIADLARRGFDGVYLDWVEAYSDESVISAARRDGKNPRREMIRFVAQIGQAGRAVSPGFIVVAQNAAELVADRGYARSIDGLAQEQVWFDGAASNRPAGDCPLPATEADIETSAYENSLSRACRRMYNDFPDSTLHVSSEGYIEDLTLARQRGLKVFTVDYTVKRQNIITAITNARQLGFVPFTSERALDVFHPPY